MKANIVVGAVLVAVAGCGGAPFTLADGDDGGPTLAAIDPQRDAGAMADEASAPEAAPGPSPEAGPDLVDAAGEAETGPALCSTTCSAPPNGPGHPATFVNCNGSCSGNCVGSCAGVPQTSKPCDGRCIGQCDAVCDLTVTGYGNPPSMVYCMGTCSP